MPGTPRLDKHRAEILARARSVPLVFERAPTAPPELSQTGRDLRHFLIESEDPAEAIQIVLRKTRRDYPLRRAIFLSEHYLYAETPLLALRLSQIIRLDHLFSEDQLVIERGHRTILAHRIEGRYFVPPENGEVDPEAPNGQLASLLLFDRVRTAEDEFGPPLHVDLRPLRRQLAFSRARLIAHTAEQMSLELTTRGISSLVVLDRRPLSVVCESGVDGDLEALKDARERALHEEQLVDPVLEAAREMIARRLPFDEPRTEEGQQDGLLRLHFRKAYRGYEGTYEFNGDQYYVFDGRGRVRLPQVCIDFVTDAFDWATGGSWPGRGQKRRRIKGALDLGSLAVENARSVESVLDFAMSTPEWFDTVWFEKEERVKFRHRARFFENLAARADLFRRGDVVFIYGLRDDGKYHYHSFFIDQKDPMTGIPTVVLANAGPPQARSFEGEMHNAPDRAIVARMRIRAEVLERAFEQARLHPGVPLRPPERAPAADLSDTSPQNDPAQ